MTRSLEDTFPGAKAVLAGPSGKAQVVVLDNLRDPAAQFLVLLRRALRETQTGIARRAADPVEALLRQGPARTWPEAAARLRFLAAQIAFSGDAGDRRQQVLARRALRDLAYLSQKPKLPQ